MRSTHILYTIYDTWRYILRFKCTNMPQRGFAFLMHLHAAVQTAIQSVIYSIVCFYTNYSILHTKQGSLKQSALF
jgi:hypothetical protein